MSILVDQIDDVVIVTLNRPGSGNSLTPELFSDLLTAYREAEASDARAIITRAEGKNFCVGSDASGLMEATDETMAEAFSRRFDGKMGQPPLGGYVSQAVDEMGFNRWAWEVLQVKVPMIALVRGAAVGGGFGLALLHHFRFGDITARFASGFQRVGLGCEMGMSYLLPAIVGQQIALDLLVTSRFADAHEAHRVGLLDRLTEAEELESLAMDYVAAIKQLPPITVRASVETLVRRRRQPLLEALQFEWERAKTLWSAPEAKLAASDLLRPMAEKKDSMPPPVIGDSEG